MTEDRDGVIRNQWAVIQNESGKMNKINAGSVPIYPRMSSPNVLIGDMVLKHGEQMVLCTKNILSHTLLQEKHGHGNMLDVDSMSKGTR